MLLVPLAADLSEEPGQAAGARAARGSYQGALEGSAKQQAVSSSKRADKGERMGAAYVRPQSQGAGARRSVHTSAQVSMRAAAPLRRCKSVRARGGRSQTSTVPRLCQTPGRFSTSGCRRCRSGSASRGRRSAALRP